MSRKTWWAFLCAGGALLGGCAAPAGSREIPKGGNPARQESQTPSNLLIIRDRNTRVALTLKLVPPWTPRTEERPYRFPLQLVSTDPTLPVSVEINAFRQQTGEPTSEKEANKNKEKRDERTDLPQGTRIGNFRGHFQEKKTERKTVVVFEGKPDGDSWLLRITAESERVDAKQMTSLITELIQNIRPGSAIFRLA